MIQGGENLVKLRAFGAVDEENLAVADLTDIAVTTHQQRTVIYLLAPDCFIQTRTERIVAEDTDDKRFAGGRECLGRPFDEMRKIEDENGLDLVLRRGLGAASLMSTSLSK